MQCQADIIENAHAVQGVEGLEKSVFKSHQSTKLDVSRLSKLRNLEELGGHGVKYQG